MDLVLKEARRLYDLGMAVHWLHNKSKRPLESGWTTGPRKDWADLESTYRKGMNVGVRLGTPSKIKNHFLAVIDVDVKSREGRHGKEVLEHLKTLGAELNLPEVKSGRGNGSRHYYILTPEPVKPFKAMQSTESVKVAMPSVAPSKRELKLLTADELANGTRLRPAWEIALMGDGQQVVLPPSIHPDSGKAYEWRTGFDTKLARGFDVSRILKKPEIKPTKDEVPKSGPKTLEGFEVVEVELSWLPITDKIKEMIMTGAGVEDRSAMLLPIAQALFKNGLSQNEILSILTDKETYMGQAAYQHAKTLDRVKAARWVYNYTLARVISENKAESFFSAPIVEPSPLTKEEMQKEQELFDAFWDWRLDLEQTKDDKYRPTLRNVVTVLENAIGEDFIKRDLFSFRDFYNADTPWNGLAGVSIVDDDITKIKFWLSQNFGFEPNSNIISEALTYIAVRNSFDPVIEWLDTLPEWDNVERLDTWLKDKFGAKGDPEYLAQVFRKWLVAMVMRAYQPGSKFDWMPIFEGAQGVGKSSFGRLLCGEKYFLDWLPDLMNKDSALALQGIWSVEMGELASFRKNEIEAVKAFITRTVDKVRPPYGERWLEVKRRSVFFGTTNFETYLRDDSGNRRFKPVKVGRLNFDALIDERDQLFAEAKYLFKAGFETEKTLEIQGDARIYEASIQSEKMVVDDASLMEEKMRQFIDSELQKNEDERFAFSKFQISDLFSSPKSSPLYAKPLNDWKLDARNVQLAAKMLKNLNAANWKSHGSKYWKITI